MPHHPGIWKVKNVLPVFFIHIDIHDTLQGLSEKGHQTTDPKNRCQA